MRGKLAMQDASEANISELTLALKAVGEDLKEFITSASNPSHSTSGSISPPSNATSPLGPKPKAVPGHMIHAHTRTASSPNLTTIRSKPEGNELRKSGELPLIPKGSPASLSSSTSSAISLPVSPSVPSVQPIAVSENQYDDGSAPPNPSQDIASALWEQRERFPKLAVPWILEYLANQVALRGGGLSIGQFDAVSLPFPFLGFFVSHRWVTLLDASGEEARHV